MLFFLDYLKNSINSKYLTSIAWFEFAYEVKNWSAPKVVWNDPLIVQNL